MGKKNRYQKLDNGDVDSSIEQLDVEESDMVEAEAAVKVEFEGWWAIRSGVIPDVHKKEIIEADFKGRKVPMVSTMADFDEALKQYGIKL